MKVLVRAAGRLSGALVLVALAAWEPGTGDHDPRSTSPLAIHTGSRSECPDAALREAIEALFPGPGLVEQALRKCANILRQESRGRIEASVGMAFDFLEQTMGLADAGRLRPGWDGDAVAGLFSALFGRLGAPSPYPSGAAIDRGEAALVRLGANGGSLVVPAGDAAIELAAGDLTGEAWVALSRVYGDCRDPDLLGFDPGGECRPPFYRFTVHPAEPEPQTRLVVDCSEGGGVDLVGHGFHAPWAFYLSLQQVELYLWSFVPGPYQFTLTVHERDYGGRVIGTSSRSVEFPVPDWHPDRGVPFFLPTVFTFDSHPSLDTYRLAFSLSLPPGPYPPIYLAVSDCEVGDLECETSCPIIQTEGTTPPLDEFRRRGIRARIYGADVGAAAAALPTGGLSNAHERLPMLDSVLAPPDSHGRPATQPESSIP